MIAQQPWKGKNEIAPGRPTYVVLGQMPMLRRQAVPHVLLSKQEPSFASPLSLLPTAPAPAFSLQKDFRTKTGAFKTSVSIPKL
jgi:hypothetical protein